jgi:hypothetical protein
MYSRRRLISRPLRCRNRPRHPYHTPSFCASKLPALEGAYGLKAVGTAATREGDVFKGEADVEGHHRVKAQGFVKIVLMRWYQEQSTSSISAVLVVF